MWEERWNTHCGELGRKGQEDMRRISGPYWLTSWTSETIVISCYQSTSLCYFCGTAHSWMRNKEDQGGDWSGAEFCWSSTTDTGAGWLMILAREGLEQWIMESKWKSKGGKMRREWRSQSERQEPVPWDNCLRRLEWKEIGTREWAFGVFSSGRFSVVKWQVSRRNPEVEDVRELLRWMCWMDHTHRY